MITITKKEIEEMIKESLAYSELSNSDKEQIISHILTTTLKKEEPLEIN